MTLFSSVGDNINESSRSLLNNKQIMTRLDDLIHNSYMTAAHEAFYFENTPNPQSQKQCES